MVVSGKEVGSTFVDHTHILGCNINNEMPQVYELDLAIRRSSIFLSCITQKYCGSHSCHHELEYANKLKKPIAFLFIENVKAKDLSNLCGVDIK